MNILIANNVAAFNNTFVIDDLLAENLSKLGGKIFFTKCSGILPACLNTKYSYIYKNNILDHLRNFNHWKKIKLGCDRCISRTSNINDTYNLIDLNSYNIQDSISTFIEENYIDCLNGKDVIFRDINITEHTFSGTVRFFANGSPANEIQYKKVFKSYFKSAVLSAELAYNIIKENNIDVVCAHHGIYVPQGPFVDIAKSLNIRVITWNIGGQKNRLFFCDNDTYHKEFPKRKVKNYKISEEKKIKVIDYLESRETGKNDWVKFHAAKRLPIKVIDKIRKSNDSAKIVSMFTNVFWDAQLHFKDNLFKDMLTWIDETIKYINTKENVYLVIREHPGEFKGQQPSRYMISDYLLSNKLLSENIILIKSTDMVNSYQLAEETDFSLVYGSKMTHELSARGVKVIVSGDAWAKNKGFTIDPISIDDYFKSINECLSGKFSRLPHDFKDLALAFCYEFYYEWQIRINSLVDYNENESSNSAKLIRKINTIEYEDYNEKDDEGLMKICSNIINNKPFW